MSIPLPRIQYAFFCENVERDQETGRSSFLNTFGAFKSPTPVGILRPFFLATYWLFEAPGPKKMSISVTDPRKRLIQEDDVSHDVRDAMNEFGVYGVQLNLEFSAMAIGDYGRYLFDLKVDGAVIGQVALLIIEKARG